jgi:hypothetical protein
MGVAHAITGFCFLGEGSKKAKAHTMVSQQVKAGLLTEDARVVAEADQVREFDMVSYMSLPQALHWQLL